MNVICFLVHVSSAIILLWNIDSAAKKLASAPSALSASASGWSCDTSPLKGNKKVLPSFSAQRALTSDDKAVFDKACGSYPMPLGTPESVSTRSIDNGTEYLFITSSKDMQGNESQQKIYVTNAGGVPEFTQVER